MNTKQLLFIILMIFMHLGVSAQVQQGVVKTRGKMVNGKLQHGKGLAGVIIQLRNHSALVSDKNGKFSFWLKDSVFQITSVSKSGYILTNEDVLRTCKRSANPLILVMETPEQQRLEELAAERKIRRNLQRQLQEKEDEIVSMKVSQQEKDSLLFILYQQQNDNEKLIQDIAKRYSTLDYDQLDEFERQISHYIEEGDLVRADSLLHKHEEEIIKNRQQLKPLQ